ncbi:hypothetical protein IMF27_06190 [Pseudomonas sp. PCH199]|uniref:hypothetical protein n=1 Tax=unclassified Pseudomonas TaxID=196821 RepID=UPI000BDA8E58|nr:MULTISPECIES: hypothetical protein [unclassified Pseudomonas]MCW8275335.1 hypothetical protein [Pseudomonas sp. PCH199]PAM84212.1 hypothetical protein CES87_06370 [Pseudomonas sp. ERMR1:02]
MIKLKKRITNPMTIIAIFATLSETSAAISLPFLDNEEREIYVWFLISFPFYLLFLFFATLNFNYRSLYSPSDFEKDEHFLKAMDDVDPKKNNASVKGSRPDSIACSAQAPPDETGLQPNLSVQHHIRLPELLKDLHIIDARWMKNKIELSSSLEKIKKPQEGQAHVILFLTGTELEKSLRESVLKYSRQTRKSGSASYCVAYDLSSHGVTVMGRSRQLTINQQ